jgi:deoxyribodipyrimidine photo-lyase
LHFGQIGAQRIAAEVLRWDGDLESRETFLEQLIVRRELSDNFCFYNVRYDSLEGCPDWALRTLEDHLSDPREHLYDLDRFEAAATHDELWNAAQIELTFTGTMPGYLRMYWAKKILEWTEHPAEAHRIALLLNDRYQLDGRDPNGYVGVAWSIGGVHDRPWTERPVFGKIRYMNASGCRRKFDVTRYVTRGRGLQGELDLGD